MSHRIQCPTAIHNVVQVSLKFVENRVIIRKPISVDIIHITFKCHLLYLDRFRYHTSRYKITDSNGIKRGLLNGLNVDLRHE